MGMNEWEKLEKVIKGMECCMRFSNCYEVGCPYVDDEGCKAKLKREALELLKAQRPVEPRVSMGWYKCGACGNGIATILDNGEPSHKERYCNLCGRAVKWG